MARDTYLLELRGANWGHALAPWAPLLPPRVALLMANCFGDVFLTFDDKSINLLNLAAGRCERIADNVRDLTELMEIDALRESWLATRLVDECIMAGLELARGQVYSYKRPPYLGGAMRIANVRISDIVSHSRMMAGILARQAG